jgi:membrane associated rhomboid family serine protease
VTTPRDPGRGAAKGVLTAVVVVLLLLVTLALQPSIGSQAAAAIFIGGVVLVALYDWLTSGRRTGRRRP